MRTTMPGIPDLEPLRRDWPEWSFWTSQAGTLVCATRRRRLSRDESYRGLAATLIESDVTTLTVQLRHEQDMESLGQPVT